MDKKKNLVISGLFLFLIFNASLALASWTDTDGDGIADAYDNCTQVSNPNQRDTNRDGIGNICDPDLNNDGVVDGQDYQIWKASADGTYNPDADLNGDGVVDDADLAILRSYQTSTGVPGPSGDKVMQYMRPRLFFTAADWSRIPTRVTSAPYSGFWKQTTDVASVYAKTILPCPINNPDNLACTGSISSLTGGEFRKFGDYLPFIVFVYKATGSTNAAYKKAALYYMDMFSEYADWGVPNASLSNNEPAGYTSDIGSDLDAAHMLDGMAIAYDWLHGDLSSAQRAKYRSVIHLHADYLYQLKHQNLIWWAHSYMQNHNYTNVGSLAIAGIALRGEDPEADDWLAAASSNFDNVLAVLSPDGASHEGVPYWSYGLRAILEYYSLMARFAPDEYNKLTLNKFAQNTALYRLYMSLPGYAQSVDYADAPRKDYRGPSFLLRYLAHVFHDGRAQWLANKIEAVRGIKQSDAWLNFAWYDPSITPISPDDLPTYHYFNNLGILVSRTDWTDNATWRFYKAGQPQGLMAMNAGLTASSHIHPDEGQFLMWGQNHWLIQDDGYVTPKHTHNHNIITFDDMEQYGGGARWFRGAQVGTTQRVFNLYQDLTGQYQYLVDEIGGINPLDKLGTDMTRCLSPQLGDGCWQRSIIMLNDGSMVVRDDINLDKPVEIQSLVHTLSMSKLTDPRSLLLNPIGSVPEAIDRTTNSNDGVVTGGKVVAGDINNALQLAPADNVTFPTLENTQFPAVGTLSFWIKGSLDQNTKNIFDRYDTARNHIFVRSYTQNANGDPGIQIAFQPNGGGSYVLSANVYPLDVTQWHNVLITWDTSAGLPGSASIYVDGKFITAKTNLPSGWSPDQQLPAFGNGFDGAFDEARLYNRVLTGTEIADLYNKSQSVADGLIAYWPFDGLNHTISPNYKEFQLKTLYAGEHPANLTDGLSTLDSSGNGNSGVITNGIAVPGHRGYGLDVSNSGNNFSVPAWNGAAFPPVGSLSLWVKANFTTAPDNSPSIFDAYDKSRDHIFIRAYKNTSTTGVVTDGYQVAFQQKDQPNQTSRYVFSSAVDHSGPWGGWDHLVITWDTVNGIGQFYLNGKLIKQGAIIDPTWRPDEQIFGFGKNINASIDDIRLYNRVISQNEVNSLGLLSENSQITACSSSSPQLIPDDYSIDPVRNGLIGSWTFDTSTLRPYVIPGCEHHGSGDYTGNLFRTDLQAKTASIIYWIGPSNINDADISLSPDGNQLQITNGTEVTNIDFPDKTVSITP